MVFNAVSAVFQLHLGDQCTCPCFPGVLLISTPHNILPKPLATFPHNHCLNNGQRWETNESRLNDYHQSSEAIMAEKGDRTSDLKPFTLLTEPWGSTFDMSVGFWLQDMCLHEIVWPFSDKRELNACWEYIEDNQLVILTWKISHEDALLGVEKTRAQPKANQINFGAELDKLNPSKTPTIYSIYPVTHCKWQWKFKWKYWYEDCTFNMVFWYRSFKKISDVIRFSEKTN